MIETYTLYFTLVLVPPGLMQNFCPPPAPGCYVEEVNRVYTSKPRAWWDSARIGTLGEEVLHAAGYHRAGTTGSDFYYRKTPAVQYMKRKDYQ